MQRSHRRRHRLVWLLIAPLLALVLAVSVISRREFPLEPELESEAREARP